MRLSVPAGEGLRAIACELATKIAEYLGSDAPEARSLGTAVERLAARLVNGREHQDRDIVFDFRRVDGELVIEARCEDRASEVRHPLPV